MYRQQPDRNQRNQQRHGGWGDLGERQVQPRQQQPPDPPGLAQLYLPHLFYASTPGHLTAEQGPANMFRTFPFPDPVSGRVPADLQCIELYEAELKTAPKSHTSTVQAVGDMEKKLVYIRRANSLVNHLMEYCKPDGNVPWLGNKTLRPTTVPPKFNTWTLALARRDQVPKASQQTVAINKLSSWLEGHHLRLPPEMTSEPSVQDEVYTQLLNPLSMLLETRYIKTNLTDVTFYPQWGRTCAARASNSTAPPDYILIGSPRAGSQCVIFEVKTWWSYSFDLFSAQTVRSSRGSSSRNSGRFHWSGQNDECKLLRQIWGQLHFNGCRWGACTNGDEIFVFHKSTEDTLCISPPATWTIGGVHHVLLGLCFAALDERKYGIDRKHMSEFFTSASTLDNDW
ncbi:hypothetical protein BU17DRAFT_103170 [Hysterangium stoloniferum]|nr:hypothetical protein BU17DRAFT_103170 [Hysterangium stoloniferum]